MRVGNVIGNTVWMLCPNTQYMKMTYKDRQGIRTYDAGLNLAAYAVQSDDCFRAIADLAGRHMCIAWLGDSPGVSSRRKSLGLLQEPT